MEREEKKRETKEETTSSRVPMREETALSALGRNRSFPSISAQISCSKLRPRSSGLTATTMDKARISREAA